jgi:hypothetical protein
MTRPLLALLALVGCPSVSRDEWKSVRDLDGDGVDGVRFGGLDCFDDDPDILVCDGDHDGENSIAAGGEDCDDADGSVIRRTFYEDRDGDGRGDPDRAVDTCDQGSLVVSADDCDDDDDRVYPGAQETCDELDRDCNGDPYLENAGTAWWLDRDGDDYGGPERSLVQRCKPGPREADNDLDCDDSRADVSPAEDEDPPYDGVDQDCAGDSDLDADHDGEDSLAHGGTDCNDDDDQIGTFADEVCDEGGVVDEDCDGRVNDEDDDADQVGQVTVFRDGDEDSFGGDLALYCPDAVPTGFVSTPGDCDDANPSANPLAFEWCNGRDDDCAGNGDDNAIDGTLAYADDDGDGFGRQLVLGRFCGALPADAATNDGDCDDTLADVYPGAPELCGDSVRQDCRLFVDVDDCDGDGFPAPADCLDDPGVSDEAFGVNPGAEEVCDGVDNDCDGTTDGPDADPATARNWYQDLDGDGFGQTLLFQSCSRPVGAVDNGLDCDDLDPDRRPGAQEACNAVDDDCDGATDEDPSVPVDLWLDADGDLWGDPAVRLVGTCTNPDPARWVPIDGDCAPYDRFVNPDADEVCDAGVDNDCDGLVDDLDNAVGATWYADADGDRYGLTADSLVSCTAQAGRVLVGGDCDDGAAEVHPGALEVCNAGVDDDCDGSVDEADASSGAVSWWRDADGDGFGDLLDAAPIVACAQPPQRAATTGDCDDSRPSVNPAADELCDPVDRDEDCDGVADQLDPSAINTTLWFLDLDLDGHHGTPTLSCDQPPGAATVGTDCNDLAPAVFPGGVELCNAFDDDCDGVVDDVAVTGRPDLDRDGFPDQSATPGPVTCGQLINGSHLDDSFALPDDCNDTTNLVRPDFPYEICDDTLDNDCDTLFDTDDPDSLGCDPGGGPGPGAGSDLHLYWPDDDGDGFGDYATTPALRAAPAAGEVANALDCNDAANGLDPLFYADSSGLATELASNHSGCVAIEVAPGAYTLSITPSNTIATVLLVGPRDGATARATFEDSRLSLANSNTRLFLTGVDFEATDLAVVDTWALQVTSGRLDLGDVVLADGGLKQTGGIVTTTATTIVDPYVTVDNVSALWVALASPPMQAHTSTDLTVVGAPGTDAVRVDSGTFTRVNLSTSSPFRVAAAAGVAVAPVGIAGSTFADCATDCLVLANDAKRTTTVSDTLVLRAGADGVRDTSAAGMNTLDHVTIVGSGSDAVYAQSSLTVRNAILWDSVDDDLAGLTLASTFSVFDSMYSSARNAVITGNNVDSTGTDPEFQSWGPALPAARWDLHLANRGFGVGAYWFNGGDVGALPAFIGGLAAPWYYDGEPDALPDGWELDHFGGTGPQGSDDDDGDGRDNATELDLGTWPELDDTDGDGTDDFDDTAPLDAGTP